MNKKECIAMLLAGGQGSRMGDLTQHIAKPAVSFGGKYRIIDFSLSNCANSGIDTIGVLTQYKPFLLNHYISTGESWDLDEDDAGVHLLPPYMDEVGGAWYRGTADSIYQNMGFIEVYDPNYVLIISGDHIYRMNYARMLRHHKEKKADVTISVMEVAWSEASRFGVMSTDEEERIVKFAEKPAKPESNLASMGIYVFSWPCLAEALIEDAQDSASAKDFGKNVIPRLLDQGKRLFAYHFNGYWRDVGTVESYYRANMELLAPEPPFNIFDREMPIMSNEGALPPHYCGSQAHVTNSIVSNGCVILGQVKNSILSPEVHVAAGARLENAVVLPRARIERDASVCRAIVGERVTVAAGAVHGCEQDGENSTIYVVNDIED